MSIEDYDTLIDTGVRMKYLDELVSYRRMGFLHVEKEEEYQVEPGCKNLTLSILTTDCYSATKRDQAESFMFRTYVISISKKGDYIEVGLIYQFIQSVHECFYTLKTSLGYQFKDRNIPILFNRTVPFILN